MCAQVHTHNTAGNANGNKREIGGEDHTFPGEGEAVAPFGC